MRKEGWTIRVVREEEAEMVCQLMQEVYEQLENKELFASSDLDYIKAHLGAEGFTVAAYDPQGKMAGNFMIRYPMEAEDNLGRDLGLPEEELCKVVHMESAVVLPAYRGNHLQVQMLQYAEGIIDTGKYTYFMATVSPDNPASYRSLEANGYQVMMTKEKYGGMVRRIYCKKVNVP